MRSTKFFAVRLHEEHVVDVDTDVEIVVAIDHLQDAP